VAAAPLAASGMFAPLLVTSQAARLPDALRSFFLDLQPGYRDDPTRAAYNHVWLLGDLDAISVGQQGSIDRLAQVKKIEIAPEPTPAPRAPRPSKPRGNSDVPSDDEVQQTLEDLLDASPDRGGKADR
jgi:hypothetical protein